MDALVDEIVEKERACGVLFGPYWRAKYFERAPERVRRQALLAAVRPRIIAGRFDMDTPVDLPLMPTSASPVTAAAETNCWDPAVWSEIFANDAEPGCAYQVYFGGIYSNRTTSSPTSLWTARWGQSGTPGSNTTLGASGAVYSGAALTNNPLFGEFVFQVRTIGATGSGVGAGMVIRGTGAGAAGTVRQTIGGTIATIDTTVNAGLIISHTWSAANASNTLTVQWVYLKALN